MRKLVAFRKDEDKAIVASLMEALREAIPGNELVSAGEEWSRATSNNSNLLAMYRQKLFAGGGSFHPRNNYEAWPHFCANSRLGERARFDGVVVPVNIADAITVNGVPAVEFGKATLEIVAAFGAVNKEIQVAFHSHGRLIDVTAGYATDFLTYTGSSFSFEVAGCLLIPPTVGEYAGTEEGDAPVEMVSGLDDYGSLCVED